jgi:hypothetical protein
MDKLCPSLLFSNPRQMTTTTTSMAIIAIVAALGLLGVVIVDSILATAQVASAAPPPTKGCRNSLAFNASQGSCFQGVR